MEPNQPPSQSPPTPTQPPQLTSEKPGHWHYITMRVKHYFRHNWKEFLLGLLVGVAASVMIYSLAYQIGYSPRRYVNVKGAEKIYSPLSGLETTQDLAGRPVTAIMIENSPDARPQSSVGQAGIVFEAVAEGGITRYLALYQETRPTTIGPVRSLRPYYLEWARGFDAPVAHVGGSAPALFLVDAYKARDLNQMHIGEKGFWRAGDRSAPHNVYTSFDRLDPINTERGYTTSSFVPYKRKKDEPSAAPTDTSISVNYSGPLYAAEFRYEAANNRYVRFLAGTPDIDRESNQQLTAKNLVVLDMPTSYNGNYAEMPAIGSGTGTVYLDGISIPMNWDKPDGTAQLKLTDKAGNEIALNRGITWFAVRPI